MKVSNSNFNSVTQETIAFLHLRIIEHYIIHFMYCPTQCFYWGPQTPIKNTTSVILNNYDLQMKIFRYTNYINKTICKNQLVETDEGITGYVFHPESKWNNYYFTWYKDLCVYEAMTRWILYLKRIVLNSNCFNNRSYSITCSAFA